MTDPTDPIRMTRRRFLAAGGGLAWGLGATPWLLGCSPEEPVSADGVAMRTALSWIKNVEYAGFWVALHEGYYAEEGIRPVLLQGGPNAPIPTVAVAAGDAVLGIDSDLRRFVDAVLNGNDLVMIGAQFQRSPAAVLSLPDRPVRQPADLLGCRFLGQQGTELNIESVLAIAGLPSDYRFIPAGYSPEPLLAGQGDAYACFVPNQPITLQMKYGMQPERDYVVTTWSELGLPGYANLLFCQRSYLDAHFDQVVGFLRGTIQGWERNRQDPELAARLAVDQHGRDLGLDLAQQIRQNEAQLPFLESAVTAARGLFWVDPDVLGGAMYDALRASGRRPLPPPERLIDLSVLEAVYGSRSRLLDPAGGGQA